MKDFAKSIKTNNSFVCNKATVLKDGNVWVVLYANETKSQEFETEEEAREFAKKVGNSNLGNYDAQEKLGIKPVPKTIPVSEQNKKTILEIYEKAGRNYDRAKRMIKEKFIGFDENAAKTALESVIGSNGKGLNESIDKQEWSMFNGLRKDADKEIGNAYKENPELTKILEAWLHNRIKEEEAREKILKITGDKNITDMMIRKPGGFIPVGNAKTGNQSAQDKFLDDINGIKAKYKQEGKEINLSRLMYELKRIGWAESDFTKLKWPTNIGNETKAEEKFGKVMGEFEEGALKTPQGKTVTDPAQAKAIAYSEADKVDNLKRARNAMKKKTGNKKYHVWTDSGNWDMVVSEEELENLKTTYKNFHYEEVK